jgi:hypothetical protein
MRWWILVIGLMVVGVPAVHADQPQVEIVKMPAEVGTRYSDPKRPPRDRPSLSGPEEAVCASDFLSDASVGGQAALTDATHAKLTINQIKVMLQLNVTIWLPKDPQMWTVEHENGHRQISEYYYQNPDAIARRIAVPYLGKVIDVSGRDLRKAISAVLQKMGRDVTGEYNRQMPVETTQARYDVITEHSRKDIPVSDAVAQALKETYSAQRETTTATVSPSVTESEKRAVPKF